MRTGRARGCVGHVHEAGFYSSDQEFLALIVPFMTEGLIAGEPVVIGYDERKCDLLRATVTRPDEVTFIADTRLYATPARAIDAYRQQFEQHVAAGIQGTHCDIRLILGRQGAGRLKHIARDQALESVLLAEQVAKDDARERGRRLARVE